MVTRRPAVAKVRVLPPGVVPMSKQDEQQAVRAIATMITQWWREHGGDEDPSEGKHAARGS
jgi:hypothetical protein